jgi:hypothetical protein
MILPDSTAADAITSEDVCTVTCRPPAFVFPNVNPLIVKVKADNDAMAVPAVVMIREVAVVAPQVAVKPATLPAETTGVTDNKKKELG